jgi:hypothetical protein
MRVAQWSHLGHDKELVSNASFLGPFTYEFLRGFVLAVTNPINWSVKAIHARDENTS